MALAGMQPALATKQVAGYIGAEPFSTAAETLGAGKVLRLTADGRRRHGCGFMAMHEADEQTRVPRPVLWTQGWR